MTLEELCVPCRNKAWVDGADLADRDRKSEFSTSDYSVGSYGTIYYRGQSGYFVPACPLKDPDGK